MVIRVFSARMKPGKRTAYIRLSHNITIPLMREQPGFLTAQIGAPREDRPDDFVFVSVWEGLESIRAFVGERWQEALIVPGEADLVEEVVVQHFDESYHSLVQMWRALADTVRRREMLVTTTPLSDAQWERIQPLLPPHNKEGRPRADDRRTLDGILYVLRTGCRWHDLPTQYGSAVTCWRRFQRWEREGTWERIWRALFATLDTRGRQAWALSFLDARFMPSPSDQHFVPTTRRRRSTHARPPGFEMAH
jgi:transposase/heme-degrading monooxygenase HmoA